MRSIQEFRILSRKSEILFLLQSRIITPYVLTIEEYGGQRRRNADQEISKIGLEATFIDGYSKRSAIIQKEYSPRLNLISNKRNLTDGEIAVYCGHRKIWREFLSS